MIYFMTPYMKGNLGAAYNACAEIVPDGKWICFMDADIMFLDSRFGDALEECVEACGRKYGLLTCLTNRIAEPSQLYGGEISNDPNAINHKKISDKVSANSAHIVETKSPISGMMMLFNKDTWVEVGGFKGGILGVDNDFHNRVVKSGKKVGVIHNLYVFHYYRMHKSVNDISHLR